MNVNKDSLTCLGRVREFFHVQQTTWPGASTVSFIYNSNYQYSLTGSQFYVGYDPLPENLNGGNSSVPGQYGNIHDEVANVTSDSYTISGLPGTIYVVAHATVAGFPVD